MQCRDFRELADSYLSDELLIETNHDMMRHLESCADCRGELAARRGLRSKLREGFQHAPELQISDEFANALKAQLRAVALSRSSLITGRVAYIAIAASLVIAAAFGFRFVYQQYWRTQNPPPINSSVTPNDRSAVLSAALAESVIGDHRDCALNHRLDEKPIPLDEAGRSYDPIYSELVSVVMSEGMLPEGVELVAGHSCVFKGKRFGHVILKYHDQIVSVLVTNNEGEDHGAPTSAEQVVAGSQFDGYQLAHFETARHAVYVVSGLSDAENLSIARAIAPSVSRHINEAEHRA
jgi:anti-sigma factor RsiW